MESHVCSFPRVSTLSRKGHISIHFSHAGKCLRGNSGPLSLPSYSPIPVEGGMSNPTGEFRFSEGYCTKDTILLSLPFAIQALAPHILLLLPASPF